MSEELIINEINENREDYIEFLRELIQTDSYNPPGNENNVAVKIENYLKDSNIECEVLPFGENRANLIAYLSDNFNGKNLLYNGHMDVVPPGAEMDWKNPPLSAFIKRKKLLFGRGSADMKSGLAAMVIALKVLKKLDIKLSGNLILNAVADEETGGRLGTGWCVENIFKPKSIKVDFSVIGEPTSLTPLPKSIILGEKGHLQLKIIANGVSCHSAVPFLGKNAIYMVSEIIQNLEKLEGLIPKVDPPMPYEKIKHLISESFANKEIFERILSEQPMLESIMLSLTKFTKSLNMIQGGIKENVIPDRCEAVMDFRLLPGQSTKVILDSLKKVINDLGYPIKDTLEGKPEEVFVYIEVFNESDASYWNDWEQSEDLKEFYSITESVYKKKPFYFLFPACADAHYYRNTGFCPATILFGPGSASTAHAVDEHVEIQDYINSIMVYSLFAVKYLT